MGAGDSAFFQLGKTLTQDPCKNQNLKFSQPPSINPVKDTNKLLVIDFSACRFIESTIQAMAATFIDINFAKTDRLDLLGFEALF